MPEPIQPSELEEMLVDVSRISEPNPEFLNSLRNRFIAEGQASAKKNQETRMKQKTFFQRWAWALVAAIVIILAVVFTRPTVVNALKRLFGYVPNVGIIDQSSQVRVLTEPVTLVRENVTATIEQVILDNEKTVIVYSYILPNSASIQLESAKYDERKPSLNLPNGIQFESIVGMQRSSEGCPKCSMRYMLQFPVMPAGIEEATLILPSLVAVPLGAAPQDWEFHLKFKQAEASSISSAIELIETPAPAVTEGQTLPPVENPYGITNTLDKFAATSDGYILFGNTAWTDARISPYGVWHQLISIKDADGLDIPFEFADPGIYSQPDELRVYWAYKIGSEFKPPLSLLFDITASVPVEGVSFDFDPGPAPQHGQTWDLNQDITINGEKIHILKAEYSLLGAAKVDDQSHYFNFTMQSDENIVGVAIVDLKEPAMGGGGGGGGMPGEKVPFSSGFGYQGVLPQGPLTFTIVSVELNIPGEWVLTWSP